MAIRRRGDHWIWIGGPVPPGSAAITIGSVISVRRGGADDARLLRHEEEHVRQWRELGYLHFLRQYLGAYLRWRRQGFGHVAAYRLIPLEVAAEAAARQFSDGRLVDPARPDAPDLPIGDSRSTQATLAAAPNSL